MLKDLIREILISFHIDLTKNLEYDRLTRKIFKMCLSKNSNCIDVGCHKGEILQMMLHVAPEGHHFAFEPIPYMYKALADKFKNKAEIFPYALSDSRGKTTFQLVKNAPAYSGIKRRHYDVQNPEIEEIIVEMRPLDEIIPHEKRIDLIKIDVEGGEFGVLKGAQNLLKAQKPLIIFECGKGASEFYGTNPVDLHHFITNEVGLNIYTLQSFTGTKNPLSEEEFENIFNENKEYYFVAAN